MDWKIVKWMNHIIHQYCISCWFSRFWSLYHHHSSLLYRTDLIVYWYLDMYSVKDLRQSELSFNRQRCLTAECSRTICGQFYQHSNRQFNRLCHRHFTSPWTQQSNRQSNIIGYSINNPMCTRVQPCRGTHPHQQPVKTTTPQNTSWLTSHRSVHQWRCTYPQVSYTCWLKLMDLESVTYVLLVLLDLHCACTCIVRNYLWPWIFQHASPSTSCVMGGSRQEADHHTRITHSELVCT